MEYIAFGEVLFEEHSSLFSSPYLFNGKELDRETNLSYFGARYYDAKVSLWLNVDPLAEKYYMNSPYIFVSQNSINLIDPTGMGEEDPPTNSVQINSQIQAIKDKFPNAPIYLMVQSGTDEAKAREEAGSPNSLSYDRYTIQEGTDYSNGSFIVNLRHGENKITGSIISTSQVNEVEKSFALDFKGAGGVGGADELTSFSESNLSTIAEIMNNLNQNVTISSNSILNIDPATTPGKGLMNGSVGTVNLLEFGNAKISTIINSLQGAGAKSSLLSRGSPNIFNQTDPNRRSGTFIDFQFSSPTMRNSTSQPHSGTIQLNKGKFQIY